MIKPDGVQRRVVGQIIQRFEDKGYELKALKLTTPPKPLLEEHYRDLASKAFFPKLMDYMSSGPGYKDKSRRGSAMFPHTTLF